MYDAAVHLTVYQHRVDDQTGVIDAGVVDQPDLTGFGVDLHLRHVTAIGVCRKRRRYIRGSAQSPLQTWGQILELVRPAGDLEEVHGLVTAWRREVTVPVDYLVGSAAGEMGCDALGPGDDAGGCLRQKMSAHSHGSCRVRSRAALDAIGVANDQPHALERHVQE